MTVCGVRGTTEVQSDGVWFQRYKVTEVQSDGVWFQRYKVTEVQSDGVWCQRYRVTVCGGGNSSVVRAPDS